MVTMFHGGGANEQRRKSSEGYDEHIERHIEGEGDGAKQLMRL